MSSNALVHSHAFRGTAVASKQVTRRDGSRRIITTKAVGWDPEGILGVPQSGHINRRMMQKQMGENKEFAAAVQMVEDKKRQEVLVKRESRRQPQTRAELVDYFLNTEAEEMEFEVARNKPMLDKEFFRFLDSEIGQERFAAVPNEDRLVELETLRTYLQEAVEALEKKTSATVSASDRMKKLLSSPDKKQCILNMVANNELDDALIDLLQQNIDAAKLAGQAKPAEFMEKVMMACKKYMITV